MDTAKSQEVLYRWGSEKTADLYDEKKQCFIDQYSSFNDSKNTGKLVRTIIII